MKIEVVIKPRERDLSDFLPPRVIAELREKHCKVEIVDSLPNGAWGSYDPEQDVIRLNASADWGKIAQAKTRTWGITVEREACWVAVIFHEMHHFENRRQVDKIWNDGRTLGQLRSYKRELDQEAEGYAANRFLSWKISCWDQGDFFGWKKERRK